MFAGAVERRRELLALLRIGRKARDQRLDLGKQRIAAGIECRGIERGIAVQTFEAVARQHCPKRGRDRYPPFGVESQRVVGDETVHDAPIPGKRGRKPPRMGYYGLPWETLGVNGTAPR